MFLLFCVMGAVCAYTVGSMPLSRLSRKLISSLSWAGARIQSVVSVLADIAKGYVSVTVFCALVGQEHAQFGVLFAYLGHLFPFCPKCRPGNGVALLLGAFVAVHPALGLFAVATWLFTFYVYRYATLSALTAAALTPIVASFVELGIEVQVLYVVAVMIFIKLRLKLRLLLEGKERIVAWSIEGT